MYHKEKAKADINMELYRIEGPQIGSYKEFYLVGHNAVQSVESQLTFR
jgi:hypothetical protein